jgi:D-alanine-D-alanine ligase
LTARKKVAIVHEAISGNVSADERDTLIQVESVETTLSKLGYETIRVPVTLDLHRLNGTLAEMKPFLVFNLVESLNGRTGYLHFVPALLDEAGVAFTGSGASALFLTTNKPLSKKLMQQAGIMTPDWQELSPVTWSNLTVSPPFIIKPSEDDASIDITDGSVVYSEDQYFDLQCRLSGFRNGTFFIESFIEGREISVSLLANGGNPEVLPPSEILFESYPEGKPRIVNYSAKWCPDSFEYSHTPRTFEFRRAEKPLLNRLKKMACRCWDCFVLRGYARVDFRIDTEGRPWVIDVNANPCLSPDSGFIATARMAGYTYEGIVTRILDEAYFHSPHFRMNTVC